MYLGLALAALGALAVYRTWSTLLFILQTPVLVRRAQREDQVLAQTHGETWRRYAERVSAWLPTGWSRRGPQHPGPSPANDTAQSAESS
jgi:protein-S-isoprenylcysteine O-methyltransferase Ste14